MVEAWEGQVAARTAVAAGELEVEVSVAEDTAVAAAARVTVVAGQAAVTLETVAAAWAAGGSRRAVDAPAGYQCALRCSLEVRR